MWLSVMLEVQNCGNLEIKRSGDPVESEMVKHDNVSIHLVLWCFGMRGFVF